MVHIYPSLMAADQKNVDKEIQLLQPHCAGFHLDIMDNIFVSNFTWNADEVNKIVEKIDNPVWIHLMVAHPFSFYEQLKLAPRSLVSFHIESEVDFFDIIKTIKEKKHRLSIAISPKTPILSVVPFCSIVDQILVMSVVPGFSGQCFLPDTFDRIAALVEHRRKHQLTFRIGIDGGINSTNIAKVVASGVDDCVIGNGIFQHKNSVEALQNLKTLISE